MRKESLIDKEFKVLDQGFVKLIDYLGNDARITQAARNTTLSKPDPKRDEGLIDYLYRNRHTSPLEFVVFTFHCKMPLFVARQWVRHRTASINEQSGRYTQVQLGAYLPEEERMQAQSKRNHQGSGDQLEKEIASEILLDMEKQVKTFNQSYDWYLDQDLAKELARLTMPVNMYTQWYWQIDLNNLLKFLSLRMESHAQWEMRQYAFAIADIVKEIVPFAWNAFEEHTMYGVHLSRTEKEELLDVIGDRGPDYLREKLSANNYKRG